MPTNSSPPRDPRLPLPGDCTLRLCLMQRAAEHPERTYAVFASGEVWTYAELHRRVRSLAAGLQHLGVRHGDSVACWLPNGPEALLVLFAVNYLGAVFAPVGVEYKGQLLKNAITASHARMLVLHPKLATRLDAAMMADFDQLVVVKGETARTLLANSSTFEQIASEIHPLDESALRPMEPWDVHALVATSGTTGASKFVPVTYAQTSATSGGFVALSEHDRALLNIPISHIGGIGVAFRALYRGGSIAVVEAFSAATFWSTVRNLNITTLTLLGAMADFLLAEPATQQDRTHPLKHVIMVPIGKNAQEFSRRFGIDIYTVFNMTEVSCPIVSAKNMLRLGSCGSARQGYALRLVDENDCEVPQGAVGELLVRSDMPWAIATEYRGDAEATARAWRNGWFHTGDRFRQDAEGYYYFVDRLKDAIRRRGENVSASEVEAALLSYPGVREAAVVAVPSELGEDEVLAALSMMPGLELDKPAMVAFLTERLAHFMVPRYIRVMHELPKTGSMKVIKRALRDEGVTRETWDRESHGFRLRRTRFDDAPNGGGI